MKVKILIGLKKPYCTNIDNVHSVKLQCLLISNTCIMFQDVEINYNYRAVYLLDETNL